MKFRIHFELPDGSEDSIDISADTIEEIRQIATDEVFKRGGKNPWSEQL